MKALHGKEEKKKRILFNFIMPAITIGAIVLILAAQRIAGTAVLLFLIPLGISLLSWLFSFVTQNTEVYVTDAGVEQRMLFGARRSRRFRWSELVYVGEIDLPDSRSGITRRLICTRSQPVPTPYRCYKIKPEDTILLDDLEENRALLAAHFRGELEPLP